MRRALATLVTIGALLSTTACGGDASDATDPSPTDETTSAAPTDGSATPRPTTEPAPEPLRIDVTISGHDVTPSGERIEASVGEPIELVVTADAPGELHVHTSPEQALEYDAGETTLELTIERPGVVEVESHDAHAVIVQLEVR